MLLLHGIIKKKRGLFKMVKKIAEGDLENCARLLIESYNCEPWNNNWTEETALRYLQEFFMHEKFIGFVSYEDEDLVGAIFAHRKTWWTADEVYVDELYIKPARQGKGLGSELIGEIEEYSKEEKLGGVTLLTNRYYPATQFYKKRGYEQAEHVIFMYKETWK